MNLSIRSGVRVAVAGALAAAAATLATPALAADTSAQDETWLVAAHQSNLAEIAAGRDAQQNAASDDVKALGAELVADHTTLDRSVTSLAQKYDVTLPSAPNPEQRAALAEVRQRSGEAYDAAWVRTQLDGHLKTRAATREELARGDAADVTAAARAATPVVQRHIAELRSIADDLGLAVPTSVDGGTGGQAAVSSNRTLAVSLAALGVALVAGGAVAAGRHVRRRGPVTT
jgi:putative membrane protein